jgi:small conductance mechanosensitive channel
MEQLNKDIITTIEGYYNSLIQVLPKLGLAILIFPIFLIFSGWLKRFSSRTINSRIEDPLLSNFIAQIVKIIFVIVGVIFALRIIGLSGAAASLLAGAGVSAFIIGFAFKDIGENFLAGIVMAFKRPFNIGDIIESGNIVGKVVGMSLRDTQVKTFEGKDVFIPNGMTMKNPIINRTIDGYIRHDFLVGLDYDDDIKAGIQIIKQALNDTPGVLQEIGKQPAVRISELGTSTMNVAVFLWTNTIDTKHEGTEVKSEAMYNTVKALSDRGYYLPADIVEIKNYNRNKFQLEAPKKAVSKL